MTIQRQSSCNLCAVIHRMCPLFVHFNAPPMKRGEQSHHQTVGNRLSRRPWFWNRHDHGCPFQSQVWLQGCQHSLTPSAEDNPTVLVLEDYSINVTLDHCKAFSRQGQGLQLLILGGIFRTGKAQRSTSLETWSQTPETPRWQCCGTLTSLLSSAPSTKPWATSFTTFTLASQAYVSSLKGSLTKLCFFFLGRQVRPFQCCLKRLFQS